MSSLTATEIAFLMVAFQQAVLAVGWLVGAGLMRDARAACWHWAAYAAFSAVSLVCWVASVPNAHEGLRAAGNLMIIGSLIALHRGLWSFFGEARGWRAHGLIVAVALVSTTLGLDPAHGAQRVTVISAVLAGQCFWLAWDMRTAARRHLEVRWGAWLAVPVAVGGLVFALRALRGLLDPSTIVALVTANSSLNVGAAAVYLAIGLVFQLTLVGLVVARLVARLRRASRHDALTGLLNRRAAEEAVAAEIGRARRLGESFSVLMIDVDHFKAVNDQGGHAAGDRVLQHLGAVFGTLLRDIDQAGRWGGEEFLVMLPGTPRAEAAALAERLRERVQALPAMWDDRPLALTLSIGVAQWRGGEAVEALVARADAALYRAKQAGRNRVECEVATLTAVA
jgi:diguanylate cyclase (GGDEF)-like protein